MDNQEQEHSRPETINNVISWLNDNDIAQGEPWISTWIKFSAREGELEMYFSLRGIGSRLTGNLLCRNANNWGRLANAFGINQNIKTVHIQFGGGLPADEIESYQCVEFKTKLRDLELLNEQRLPIMGYQCPILSICLEGLMTSTEHSIIGNVTRLSITGLSTQASVFHRLLDVCSDVYLLSVYCSSPSHCSAVASFLRNTNTVQLTVEFSHTLSSEDQATIIHGLRENTSLRYFHLNKLGLSLLDIPEYDPHGYFAKALCDSSSIDNILNSNHTLTDILDWMTLAESELSDSESVLQFKFEHDVKVANCLELNENTDTDKVIREKIARYYFAGDFDVSPLANLPVSVVPSVLGMIRGNKLDRQFAIFRLLISIPDLCNVASRMKIVCNDDDDDHDIEAAKFGACDNKKRRMT
eukprot:scaffold46676_cov22-Cyclotella_meneghiniana.AAC.2